MYQKFIITQDGELRFGHVYLHRDLLHPGESCPYGGGVWKVDEARHAILLFGRSFDFGPPNFYKLTRINWNNVGGKPIPPFTSPAGLTTKLKFPLWWA